MTKCLRCGGHIDIPFSDLCSSCYITLPGQDEIHQGAKYTLDADPDRDEPSGYFGPIHLYLEADDGQLAVGYDEYAEHMRQPIDATPWFKQADDKEIEALVTAGLRNTIESDLVVIYMLPMNERIKLILDYCSAKDIGWTASLDVDHVRWWIETNRPTLWSKING